MNPEKSPPAPNCNVNYGVIGVEASQGGGSRRSGGGEAPQLSACSAVHTWRADCGHYHQCLHENTTLGRIQDFVGGTNTLGCPTKRLREFAKESKLLCTSGVFLVICAAGYRSSANTIGSLFQKHVCSTFSMKMVLNCVHIWSADLFLVKDKAPVRNLIKSLFKECSNLCSIFHLSGNVDANHARPMGLFFFMSHEAQAGTP